jgi:hypothetical protein
MKQAASDIFGALGIALMLGGVNDMNPYQYLCLALAAISTFISFKLGQK